MTNSIYLELPTAIWSNVISFLPHQAQLDVKPLIRLWYQASQQLSCQFAHMRSITMLPGEAILEIFQEHPRLIEKLVHHTFHQILDPNYEVSDSFLALVLEHKYGDNTAAKIAFLRSFSVEKRNAIRSLDFSNDDITDAQVTEILTLCPNVRSLSLSSSKITGKFLTKISEQNQLEKLSLFLCENFNEDFLKEFLSQKAFHLKELGLDCINITGEALSHILVGNQLETLSLSNCQNLNESLLKGFLSMKAFHLKKLVLSSSNTTGEALSNILQDNQLEKLDLFNCRNLNESLLKDFLSMKAFHLKKLDLSSTETTGEGLLHITEGNHLETLFLYNCENLNENFLKRVFSKASCLKELDLSSTNTTGEGLSCISVENLLEKLLLRDCRKLNEAFLKNFFPKVPRLKELDLSSTNTTGEGLSLILKDNQLEKVHLTNCLSLGGIFLRDFFSLKASFLKELDLANTNTNGKSLPYLLKENQLERLNLNCCSFLNEDFLGEFLSLKAFSLKELRLSSTEITGKAFSHISDEHRLESLVLYNCKHLNKDFLEILEKTLKVEL
ncbi:MAG: hypothetical protein PVI40_08690 [Chlamydiota bacterium]|jgi:hypothetical protein